MELGNQWFPGFDEENMKTVDTQLSALLRFVGAGVISGWLIKSLKLVAEDDPDYSFVTEKRNALVDASSTSALGQLHALYGNPSLSAADEKIWSRMLVITPGYGVVGLYKAQTTTDAYILLPNVQQTTQYMIWAQPSVCLVADGLCAIGYTDGSDDTYDYMLQTSTYLGTILLTKVDLPGDDYDYTVDIEYSDERKNLYNLTSALQDSLNTYFYRHVHAGLPTHPSKIELSTEKILTASVPEDYQSTTFLSVKDDSGNVFTWNDADYGTPKVYLDSNELPENNYNLDSETGRIYLKNSLPVNSFIQVVLPLLVIEIEGKLSGKRLKDVDASSIKRGTLGQNRFQNLDHVGQVRFKETANLNPYLRLIDEGDHQTFYPEITNGFPEYNSRITVIYKSITQKKTIIGTRHGLYQTVDFTNITPVSSWTPDMGVPIFITDNVFDEGLIHYSNTYILTEEGKIYYTTNLMTSWSTLKLPRIQLYGNQIITPKITALVVSTNKRKSEGSLVWQTVYYVGTEANGIFGAIINDDQTENEWQWSRVHLESFNEFESITALANVATIRSTVSQNLLLEETDRSLYVGTKNGLYLSLKGAVPCVLVDIAGIDFITYPVLNINVVQNSDGMNDIMWHTESKAYITRDAEKITINTQNSTTIYWNHPFDYYEETTNILSSNVATDASNTDIVFLEEYPSMPTISTSKIPQEGGSYIINGYQLQAGISRVLFTHFADTDTELYAKYNGVYIYDSSDANSSTFTRYSGFTNAVLQNNLFVTESNGSLWYLPKQSASPVLNTTSLLFEKKWYSLINNSTVYIGVVVSTNSSNTDIVVSDFLSDSNTLYIPIISSINDVSINNDDYVLFTHFTNADKKYNGVYELTGDNGTSLVFTRISEMYISENLKYTSYIKDNSTGIYWIISGNSDAVINSSDIEVIAIEHPFTADSFLSIKNMCGAKNNEEILIFANTDIYAIKNYQTSGVWNNISLASKKWKSYSSGVPSAIFDLAVNTFIIGSNRGLWETSTNGNIWERPYLAFAYVVSETSAITRPTVYNAETKIKTEDWFIDSNSQSVVFNNKQDSWIRYIYEKDYVDYFVSPWVESSDVIVYENSAPVTVAYRLSPSDGKITFSSQRAIDSVIKITVIRQGAFISNTGDNNHEELQNVLIVATSPVTVLAQDLLVSDTTLVVKDPTVIPTDTEYLEIRLGTVRERLNITRDSNNAIQIISPRTTDTVFSQDYTNVYLASVEKTLGIEDYLSLFESNQTYHFNSLGGANLLQLTMAAKTELPEMFTNFNLPSSVINLSRYQKMAIKPISRYSPSINWINQVLDPINDWGMKNTYFLDSNTMSAMSAEYNPYIGYEPSANEFVIPPRSVYSVYNTGITGENQQIFSDTGVWIFKSGNWEQQSKLGSATSVYFASYIEDQLVCGTNTGLWEYNNNTTWVKNPLYTQVIYDHLVTDWFGGTCWVTGKDDGLAFVWQAKDSTIFTSDSFNDLNGLNVYGLFKNYFIRIDKNNEQVRYDVMYICTEKGIYGVTNGKRLGQYASFLAGRELFGASQLTHEIETVSGTQTVPVKIYKVFQNGRPLEFRPIILLTNNGIYVVRNWRWTDPLEASDGGYNFYPESHSLEGLTCYSYVNTKSVMPPPDPLPVGYPTSDRTVYKIFVGTNNGAYRSYDDGYIWEQCERITDMNLTVYGLSTYTGVDNAVVLLALTNDGLYTSIDDGDNWIKPSINNPNASYNSVISPGLSFG